MARWGGRKLDGMIVGGLVVTSVFGVRPRAHFLARSLGLVFGLAAAVRLLVRTQHWHFARPEPVTPSSTLVSIVAHEIRAPLASIRGSVALLEEHDAVLDAKRRAELFAVALDATGQLAHLVDDLLLVSRIAGGRLRVADDELDIMAVVREAANAAMSRQIIIVDQTGVPRVGGDAMRVRQVLTNLLSNAVANAIEASVVLVSVTKHDDSVRVTIYNEGRGIPPEEQSRLFLPFASLTERRVDSTGLGLYIAKQLVEAMNGTIGFDTQPGQSAAFWFTLKAATNATGSA